MFTGLYTGSTGMKTHSSGLQTISNNLANVNTVGYKQKYMLFDDMMYQNLALGSFQDHDTGIPSNNQLGLGVGVGSVRTLFTQGGFEPSNTVTDLAIAGKGFFQVVDGDKTHYTRAGNFRFNIEGELEDSNGFTLSGIPIVDGQKSGGLQPVKIDPKDPKYKTNPAKASSELTAIFNLGFTENASENATDPMFSLLSVWNANGKPPLDKGQYGYSQPMRIYDENGKTHEATIYFDATTQGTGGQKIYEYIVAINPELDGSAAAGTEGAGLLMAGTLTFSSAGELMDMSSFSPSGANKKDLSTWTPSQLSNGNPVVNVQFATGGTQSFNLNMGLSSSGNAWVNAPASAADVALNPGALPSLGTYTKLPEATTAYSTSSTTKKFTQNGYGVGDLNDLYINNDGTVQAKYTNGQTVDMYSIPVFRFVNEDGLRNEGNNHFSATDEAGTMAYGEPGTENYGLIKANTLETSNVDMSREMVNMIIIQRGFQMNSKTVTTVDTMIQKALEMKR